MKTMGNISEALSQFRSGPAALEAALAAVTAEETDFSPAPGKWNIRQIVRHLADTEIVAGMRLRHIAAEDKPTLVPFDQDTWATRLGYATADLSVSLNTFTVLRNDTARRMLDFLDAGIDDDRALGQDRAGEVRLGCPERDRTDDRGDNQSAFRDIAT